MALKDLGVRASLQQTRGDWAWYKQIFGFKGWSGTHICWMCNVTKRNMNQFKFNASWRTNRHTTASMMNMIRLSGVVLSVLFSIPGFEISMIMVDVLHTLDLGVSQDILGNVFWEDINSTCFAGGGRVERCQALMQRIRQYYKIAKPPAKISKFNRGNDKICQEETQTQAQRS